MHGTALPRTQRTRRTSAGHHRARPLKNWLSRHRTPRRGTHGPCGRACLRNRSHDSWRRSFVYRTRPSLRNDHAGRRRLRRSGHHGRNRTRVGDWSLRCDRGRNRRRCRRRRRNYSRWRRRGTRRYDNRRRRLSRDWRRDRNSGSNGLLRHGRDHFRSHGRRWSFRHWNRRRSGRRCRSCRRRRRRDDWPRRHGERCGPGRRRNRFFLLGDRFQHISRPGNMRQVDLGLDFFFAAQQTRGAGRRRLRFGRAAEVDPHLFRFMLLERTGMGLLLRHPDDR
jgi:hypothetical protein